MLFARSLARASSASSTTALARSAVARRPLATATSDNFVKIVEVSPRDGLQNEKSIVPTATKLELLCRLGQTGLRVIEAGAFVSPKWVPQMGDTPQLLRSLPLSSTTTTTTTTTTALSYPVLVPNAKGLESLQSLIAAVRV